MDEKQDTIKTEGRVADGVDWTARCNETLAAWRWKVWGLCATCGQMAWYQHLGFSLCGVCAPSHEQQAA